ncbi:flagellar basal-body rod protein FlgF [Actibacterium sp. MT2.3-13A]|uniref:flagellar basal-body rod protein FlgF n=1 Tax=Actibacterium sp. MT2.3-13A TaxID=2828332 RepID=UPI001BAC8538|nr:flagellar basal-body rod protein FlgF [Actibacterium sp. MT2.3-13A]
MDNSIYVSLSLATAMRREMDVTANNIANANTAGFKGERVVFDSFLHDAQGPGAEGGTSFVVDRGSYLDERQGAVTQTGNTLDVALQGPGWFSYQTPEGRLAYGRDGRFGLDSQGNLITLSGARVLDIGGGPIALPPDLGSNVTITKDGSITAEGRGVIAQLGVFTLPDLQSYERIGNGLFVPPESRPGQARPVPDPDTEVVQGAIEASNVQPVVEMTRMMSIQRAYERAAKLMSGADDLRRDTLRRLGQTG